MLIGFNTGRYEAIDLSQWIAGNPVEVLATNFGQPASLDGQIPARTGVYHPPLTGSKVRDESAIRR